MEFNRPPIEISDIGELADLQEALHLFRILGRNKDFGQMSSLAAQAAQLPSSAVQSRWSTHLSWLSRAIPRHYQSLTDPIGLEWSDLDRVYHPRNATSGDLKDRWSSRVYAGPDVVFQRFDEKRTAVPGLGLCRLENRNGEDIAIVDSESASGHNRLRYVSEVERPRRAQLKLSNAAVLRHATANYCHTIMDAGYSAWSMLDLLDDPSTLLLTPKVNIAALAGILKATGVPFHDAQTIDAVVEIETGWIVGQSYQRSRLSELRDLVRKAHPPNQDERENLLYLSRSDASARPLTNESEVEHLVRSFGGRVINCSDLTPIEQWTIIGGAQTVIGPHGAALTNVLFAPSGANLLELMPPHFNGDMFQDLSGHFELNASRLYGIRDRFEESEEWSIDLEELSHRMDHLCSDTTLAVRQ